MSDDDIYTAGAVRGTGRFAHLAADADAAALRRRRELLDQPGAHLWVIVAGWAITDPRAPDAILDAENLLTITGPGCFKCGRPFSNRLARRPCRGSIR